MKAQEFKEMTIKEIQATVKNYRERLLKIRFDIASRQIKNHREARSLKKEIARALTVMSAKK